MADFITSDGLRLHFEDTGAGQPLLCLAGLTRNCRDFDPLRGVLTECRIISMDYRGRGQSDFDPDYLNYNILREGHDALELLDLLDLDKVTVLGTSRGGLIAMELAASHSERLAGVILNDVGPQIGPAGLARIMDYLGMPPKARSYDEAATQLKAAMERQFPGVPLSVWRRQAEAQYGQTADGLTLRYDPHLRRAILEQSAGERMPDLWLLFEALKSLPVAVLHGANSDVLLPDTLEEMQRRHPGMIVRDIPDRGHVPFLDEPECIETIRAILKRPA